MDYFIQFIGIIGFIFGIIAFSQKEDKNMKLNMSISSFLLTINFYLLEAYTLALLKCLNTFRNFLSIYYSSSYILFSFLILYWILGYFTIKENIDYIPIITITISTFAMFKLKGINLKIAFLPANIVWIIFSLYKGSIGGFMLETLVLIVNIKTILSMHKNNKMNK